MRLALLTHVNSFRVLTVGAHFTCGAWTYQTIHANNSRGYIIQIGHTHAQRALSCIVVLGSLKLRGLCPRDTDLRGLVFALSTACTHNSITT